MGKAIGNYSQDQRMDLGINRQVAGKTRHEAIWEVRRQIDENAV